jgi:hypothetical protein
MMLDHNHNDIFIYYYIIAMIDCDRLIDNDILTHHES